MDDLASEIRANIASLESDVHELRKSAKKNLDYPEKERQIHAELRGQMTRLEELTRNLASLESANDPAATSQAEPRAEASVPCTGRLLPGGDIA